MSQTTETTTRYVVMCDGIDDSGHDVEAILTIDETDRNPKWGFTVSMDEYCNPYHCTSPGPDYLRRFIGNGDLGSHVYLRWPLISVDLHTGKIKKVVTVTTKTVTVSEI